jgi:hypothetical protein
MKNYVEDHKLQVSHKIKSPLKREPVPIYREAGGVSAVHFPATSIQFFAWSPSGFPEADTQTGVMIHYFKQLLEKRIEVQAQKNHSTSGKPGCSFTIPWATQSPINNHKMNII